MKNLGLKVDTNVNTKRRLLESQVTKGGVSKKVGDISVLEQSVAEYESLIQDQGALTVANVKTLMDLYQQTIEYYSALGDDKFAYYLKNMHQMLGREDISIILSSAEEEAAAAKKRESDIINEEQKVKRKPPQLQIEQNNEIQKEQEEEDEYNQQNLLQIDDNQLAQQNASVQIAQESKEVNQEQPENNLIQQPTDLLDDEVHPEQGKKQELDPIELSQENKIQYQQNPDQQQEQSNEKAEQKNQPLEEKSNDDDNDQQKPQLVV